MRGCKIFAGSSNYELAKLITDRLASALSPVKIKQKENSETNIEVGVSVRNQDVFIIQSGSSPVNDNLMELLVLVNACKFASAKRITAVIPFFPYSKQSKKKNGRAPITAKCKLISFHLLMILCFITFVSGC